MKATITFEDMTPDEADAIINAVENAHHIRLIETVARRLKNGDNNERDAFYELCDLILE